MQFSDTKFQTAVINELRSFLGCGAVQEPAASIINVISSVIRRNVLIFESYSKRHISEDADIPYFVCFRRVNDMCIKKRQFQVTHI
jgi:hypothetical protein